MLLGSRIATPLVLGLRSFAILGFQVDAFECLAWVLGVVVV